MAHRAGFDKRIPIGLAIAGTIGVALYFGYKKYSAQKKPQNEGSEKKNIPEAKDKAAAAEQASKSAAASTPASTSQPATKPAEAQPAKPPQPAAKPPQPATKLPQPTAKPPQSAPKPESKTEAARKADVQPAKQVQIQRQPEQAPPVPPRPDPALLSKSSEVPANTAEAAVKPQHGNSESSGDQEEPSRTKSQDAPPAPSTVQADSGLEHQMLSLDSWSDLAVPGPSALPPVSSAAKSTKRPTDTESLLASLEDQILASPLEQTSFTQSAPPRPDGNANLTEETQKEYKTLLPPVQAETGSQLSPDLPSPVSLEFWGDLPSSGPPDIARLISMESSQSYDLVPDADDLHHAGDQSNNTDTVMRTGRTLVSSESEEMSVSTGDYEFPDMQAQTLEDHDEGNNNYTVATVYDIETNAPPTQLFRPSYRKALSDDADIILGHAIKEQASLAALFTVDEVLCRKRNHDEPALQDQNENHSDDNSLVFEMKLKKSPLDSITDSSQEKCIHVTSSGKELENGAQDNELCDAMPAGPNGHIGPFSHNTETEDTDKRQHSAIDENWSSLHDTGVFNKSPADEESPLQTVTNNRRQVNSATSKDQENTEYNHNFVESIKEENPSSYPTGEMQLKANDVGAGGEGILSLKTEITEPQEAGALAEGCNKSYANVRNVTTSTSTADREQSFTRNLMGIKDEVEDLMTGICTQPDHTTRGFQHMEPHVSHSSQNTQNHIQLSESLEAGVNIELAVNDAGANEGIYKQHTDDSRYDSVSYGIDSKSTEVLEKLFDSEQQVLTKSVHSKGAGDSVQHSRHDSVAPCQPVSTADRSSTISQVGDTDFIDSKFPVELKAQIPFLKADTKSSTDRPIKLDSLASKSKAPDVKSSDSSYEDRNSSTGDTIQREQMNSSNIPTEIGRNQPLKELAVLADGSRLHTNGSNFYDTDDDDNRNSVEFYARNAQLSAASDAEKNEHGTQLYTALHSDVSTKSPTFEVSKPAGQLTESSEHTVELPDILISHDLEHSPESLYLTRPVQGATTKPAVTESKVSSESHADLNDESSITEAENVHRDFIDARSSQDGQVKTTKLQRDYVSGDKDKSTKKDSRSFTEIGNVSITETNQSDRQTSLYVEQVTPQAEELLKPKEPNYSHSTAETDQMGNDVSAEDRDRSSPTNSVDSLEASDNVRLFPRKRSYAEVVRSRSNTPDICDSVKSKESSVGPDSLDSLESVGATSNTGSVDSLENKSTHFKVISEAEHNGFTGQNITEPQSAVDHSIVEDDSTAYRTTNLGRSMNDHTYSSASHPNYFAATSESYNASGNNIHRNSQIPASPEYGSGNTESFQKMSSSIEYVVDDSVSGENTFPPTTITTTRELSSSDSANISAPNEPSGLTAMSEFPGSNLAASYHTNASSMDSAYASAPYLGDDFKAEFGGNNVASQEYVVDVSAIEDDSVTTEQGVSSDSTHDLEASESVAITDTYNNQISPDIAMNDYLREDDAVANKTAELRVSIDDVHSSASQPGTDAMVDVSSKLSTSSLWSSESLDSMGYLNSSLTSLLSSPDTTHYLSHTGASQWTALNASRLSSRHSESCSSIDSLDLRQRTDSLSSTDDSPFTASHDVSNVPVQHTAVQKKGITASGISDATEAEIDNTQRSTLLIKLYWKSKEDGRVHKEIVDVGTTLATVLEEDDSQVHYFTNVRRTGPAYRMAIRDGDVLVRLNGMPVSNWSHDILLEQIRLLNDTEIIMTVKRQRRNDVFLKNLQTRVRKTKRGIAVSDEVLDVTESQLPRVLEMQVAASGGIDNHCPCRITSQDGSACLRILGRKLKMLPPQDHASYIFSRQLFNCTSSSPISSPSSKSPPAPMFVVVLSGSVDVTTPAYMTVISRKYLTVMKHDRISSRAHDTVYPDARFFFHHQSPSYDCFESTQLPHHFLAYDGEDVFMKMIVSAKDIETDPELHFKIVYLG